MKRFKQAKTAIAALLILVLSGFLLSGCGKESENIQPVDEDGQIIEKFRELYGRAKIINTAVFGSGFEAEDEEEASREYSAAHFCVVNEDCPYKDTEEFKAAIDQTFSEAYAQTVKSLMFEGVPYNTDELVNIQPRYKDIGGRLAINVNYEGFSVNSELDTEKAEIKEKGSYDCIVTVPYFSDGKQIGSIDVRMVKEKGSWRLDSATY